MKEKYKQIYHFVFVDEFQDLNLPQIILLQMLCEDGRITVCGDPDQSIYGFRGAYGSLAFTNSKNIGLSILKTSSRRIIVQKSKLSIALISLIEHNLDDNGKKKIKDIYEGASVISMGVQKRTL